MKKQKLLRWAIKQRKVIQVIIGVALYIMIGYYHISLWYVLLFGAITGVIMGKVFCRWMCPMGVMMEFLMGMTPGESFRQTYQYHKLGCPIAWISGWLNRFSFYRISLNKDTCKSCGICDKQCYISTLNSAKYSIYQNGKEHPGASFSCSKCLQCVSECPNGSLTYRFAFSPLKAEKQVNTKKK
jgi:polyferredoxin